MTKHLPLLLLYSIVTFGAFLRFYNLTGKNMWVDEIACVNVAKLSIHDQVVYTLYTPREIHLHPPLYTILLHLFLYLGDNELIARLPSAIFGVLAIWLIFKTAKLLFGVKEGLISAFLLSISVTHFWLSRETVMYSQFMFFSLLSFFFFYKAMTEKKGSLWIGFVISTLLGIYTHFYMFYVVLVEALFFIYFIYRNGSSIVKGLPRLRRKAILGMVVTLAIAGVLLLPIFQFTSIILTRGDLGREYGAPPESLFVRFFGSFSGDYRSYLGNYMSQNLGLLLYLPVFFVGVLLSIKKCRLSAIFLLVWVFLPMTVIWIVSSSFGEKTFASDRHVIFILPGYLVGVSKGISNIAGFVLGKLNHPRLRQSETKLMLTGLLIAAVLFGGFGANALLESYKDDYPDWRSACEYLKLHVEPGGFVVMTKCPSQQGMFYYYYREGGVNVSTVFPVAWDLISSNLSSIDAGIWFITPVPPRLDTRNSTEIDFYISGLKKWISDNHLVIVGRFRLVVVLCRPKGQVLISTNVDFAHANSSVTFNVHLPADTEYSIALRATSSNESTLEVAVDNTYAQSKTFKVEEGGYADFYTVFLRSGLHSITIINHSDPSVETVLEKIAIWPIR